MLVFIAAAADGRTVRSRWFNFFMKSVQISIFYFGIFGDQFLLANIFVVFLVWPLLFQSTLVTLKKKEGKADRTEKGMGKEDGGRAGADAPEDASLQLSRSVAPTNKGIVP